jgi:hypothetical protein
MRRRVKGLLVKYLKVVPKQERKRRINLLPEVPEPMLTKMKMSNNKKYLFNL